MIALLAVAMEARLKSLLTREELFLAIRREKQRDPTLSGRALARQFQVTTRTVAAALVSPAPPAPKPRRRASTLAPVTGLIDAMLLEEKRDHKLTIDRICRRLAAKHGFDTAYSTVLDYVAWRRPEMARSATPWRRQVR